MKQTTQIPNRNIEFSRHLLNLQISESVFPHIA